MRAVPSGPAAGPPGTETKRVKVIYTARCTYSTYISIGNGREEEGRGGGSPPQPGVLHRGREEESAFTQRLLLAPVCLGGLSDALSILGRGLGGSWRAGKTLKLDRDLSRPSDMRGAPGSQLDRPPLARGGGLGSHCPVPCLGPAPRRSRDNYSPGDEAACAVLSSRGVSEPSSEHGPGWWLSLESETGASLAGGDRGLCVHLVTSVWKLPTGVVPPDDSPARDLSSSRWASSMSLSLLSLTVSCSMVWKMLPTSLRARPGGERLGRLAAPPPPPGGQAGRLSGCEGSVLESGGPAGMLT